jgi:cell wall-associated NlpC family hydrolase
MNTGTAAVGSAWQTLSGTAATHWGKIGSTISSTYSQHIVPSWNGVKGFANSTGAFFGSVASGMNRSTSTSTHDLSAITVGLNGFFKMVAGKVPAGAKAPVLAADGGLITQGTGPRTDDVPARLSRGEFVVNAAATSKHLGTLTAINSERRFADGGLVGDKVEGAVTGAGQQAVQSVVSNLLSKFAATVSGFITGSVSGVRGKFLDAVASKMGTAYVWGAAGPNVFDCSGLMSWGLEQAGAGKGRLTAQDFNAGFPHIPASAVVPGDLVTFDTGRIPGQAGHIGAVMDVSRHLMMNTDGSGPAAVADYQSRDGGPLSFIDPIGGAYIPAAAAYRAKPGDPPSAGWLAGILAQIKAGGTGAAASSNTPPGAANTAGTEQWRADVVNALRLEGQSVGLANVVLNQMRTESSGNQNAINLTDSNATQLGTPSKGLMQVIDPTFQTYRDPKLVNNIWDPMANIAAAIRYATAHYGSLVAGMRGLPYASGGIIPGAPSGKDTVPAWLSPGEAVISRQGGAETANKAYLGQAASWFGGTVNYPGDMKAMPPNMTGMGQVTVNPTINLNARVFVGGRELMDDVRVVVDNSLVTVTNSLNRKAGQG